MIELEKTYLLKRLPAGLSKCRHAEIIDIYIPKEFRHPTLRLRKLGERYEMTKKEPLGDGDASNQEEQTISLTEKEFTALSRIEGKRLSKIRYYYPCKGKTAEIDVFQERLLGLIWVDVEFGSVEEKAAFTMPEFCLVEVTQEEFIAGGMVCGKGYEDIEKDLKRFGYKKLFLE
jgi:CYTH domain-containing protein